MRSGPALRPLLPGLLVAILLAAAPAAWAEPPPRYELVPLGTMTGDRDQIVARGLTDSGVIVGDARTPQGHVAFIWLPDRGMHEIGVRSGGHHSATAQAVNEELSVVGASGFSEVPAPAYAFRWHPDEGVSMLAPALREENVTSRATDINALGQVVGVAGAANADRAFIWDVETGLRKLLDESAAAQASRAESINDHGQVAGTLVRDGTARAFLWSPAAGVTLLETGADANSHGLGINDHGDVVGRVDRGTRSMATLWPSGAPSHELGLLDPARPFSAATDVNNSGVVVGKALTGDGFRAFVWTQEHGMRRLDHSLEPYAGEAVVLHGATAINNVGSIAAFGRRKGSDRARSFLLMPVRDPVR